MMEIKQDDEMLDRLLAGLGVVPVEQGFAERVKRGVEARTAAAEARPVRWRSAMWGFVSVTAVLLCVVAVHEVQHRGVSASTAKNAPLILPNAASPGTAPSANETAAVQLVAPRRTVTLHHKAAALDEHPVPAALASFPAPEAPLTEQERLLLRIVHRGDPVEVAMLNPQEQAREEAAEAAEFQRFFPPKRPAPNVVPEDLTKEKGETQ